MDKSNSYDYIIAGAGAAGLSLIWCLLDSSTPFSRILLVDQNLNPDNSKTWCFWSDDAPELSPFIKNRWSCLKVRTAKSFIRSEKNSYDYFAVGSGSFSQSILDLCRRSDRVDMIEGHIDEIKGDDQLPQISVNGTGYRGSYIFQSCFYSSLKEPTYPLGQHFVGWDVETTEDLFDENCATLMDFDTGFDRKGTAFMYILPWSKRKALFEYTIFSPDKEEESFYEQKIEKYLFEEHRLSKDDYTITRKEQGFIPMEDRSINPWYAKRVLTIGFPSGISKPSTGYTFKNIQRQTKHIVRQLEIGNSPAPLGKSPLRYRICDLLLLHILYQGKREECLPIFDALFTKNEFREVFKFLDEETSLTEDLKIMSSVPYAPFMRAIYATQKQLLGGAF